jgi:serine/threonine-protein kinase
VTDSAGLGHLGGFELVEVIARGGMGIVYHARRQRSPERDVALKALPGAELVSEEARQRFKIEAQAMARLDHPHILPVYEIGEQDGTPFYTMKLATSGTLAQRITVYVGKCREVAELIATLAEAVQFAHSRGVLHRDLKPGNILFDDSGTMYVSDFGLAKLVGTDTDLTRTIAMMGTPTYLAPELVNGGKHGVSAASDVWSLGVMLYELLAGRPPFRAENTAALLRQIVDDEPPALVARSSQAGDEVRLAATPYSGRIPRDLAVITFKALAKDPARRYATAQKLADDLHRWLSGEPIHARPVPLAERVWLWAKRKPSLAAALTLLALTLIGSAAMKASAPWTRSGAVRFIAPCWRRRTQRASRRSPVVASVRCRWCARP